MTTFIIPLLSKSFLKLSSMISMRLTNETKDGYLGGDALGWQGTLCWGVGPAVHPGRRHLPRPKWTGANDNQSLARTNGHIGCASDLLNMNSLTDGIRWCFSHN